jgi:hypothetical protein
MVRMGISRHHQDPNHSQFFEPETNLNLSNLPSFCATV